MAAAQGLVVGSRGGCALPGHSGGHGCAGHGVLSCPSCDCFSPLPSMLCPSPPPAVVLHRGQLLGLRGKSTGLPPALRKKPPPKTPRGPHSVLLPFTLACTCLEISQSMGSALQAPLCQQPTRHPPHLGRGPAQEASSTCTATTAPTNRLAASSPTAPWPRLSSASMGTGMLSSFLSQCQVSGSATP